MQGQIQSFSIAQNQGTIQGQDGGSYLFESQHWHYARVPQVGEMVSFITDTQGNAIDVYPINNVPSSTVNLAKSNNNINTAYANRTNTRNAQDWSVIANQHSTQLAVEEQYGFFDWVKKSLVNYANFKGRARRKEYWYFYLALFGFYLIGMIIDDVMNTDGVFTGLIALALFLPNLAVMVRRLHDVNRSGWWALVSFIPFIGSLLLILWLATDSKPNINQWGAPARRLDY